MCCVPARIWRTHVRTVACQWNEWFFSHLFDLSQATPQTGPDNIFTLFRMLTAYRNGQLALPTANLIISPLWFLVLITETSADVSFFCNSYAFAWTQLFNAGCAFFAKGSDCTNKREEKTSHHVWHRICHSPSWGSRNVFPCRVKGK